jgi:beta-lactam-binding protein with PASTA domain
MTKVKTIQLGRPVNKNSERQKRLKDLEKRRKDGTLKLGRPVNVDSVRQKRLVEIENRRNNGEVIKRGRPKGSGVKVSKEKAVEISSKRFKVEMSVNGETKNYSKLFKTPKSAIKEMKEVGIKDYKLVEVEV